MNGNKGQSSEEAMRYAKRYTFVHFLLAPSVCSQAQRFLFIYDMVNQIKAGLWKMSSVKRNDGHFCSWPRRLIKDQIYSPTGQLQLVKTYEKVLRHWMSGIERQLTPERWETSKNLYNGSSFLPWERFQGLSQGKKPNQSPGNSLIWEAETRHLELAGQRPEGRES